MQATLKKSFQLSITVGRSGPHLACARVSTRVAVEASTRAYTHTLFFEMIDTFLLTINIQCVPHVSRKSLHHLENESTWLVPESRHMRSDDLVRLVQRCGTV
jgi:hypothetical protein